MAPKQRIRILKDVNLQEDPPAASKKRIRILKDVNLNANQEDPPPASKQRIRISKERLRRASNRRWIWKERARASKRKGNSKARKDLQKDPPSSSSAEATLKLDSCSHPSSSLGACDVPEELLPEIRETTPKPDSCSHPSSSFGVCDVCDKFLPTICGVPFEITQRWLGRISTEDVLWAWP